jgi:predicted ATPase with chaperone activity
LLEHAARRSRSRGYTAAIADLAGADSIDADHVAESLQFRMM